MHSNETPSAPPMSDTQERLLEATLAILYEEGIDRTTTRRITGRAGVNLQLIQYHFGGKEGLIMAAQEHARRRFMEAIRPAVSTAPSLGAAIRAGLETTWAMARTEPIWMQPDLLLQVRRSAGQAPGQDLPARETRSDLVRLLGGVMERTGERLTVPIEPFVLLLMSGAAGLLMEHRISGDETVIGAAFALLGERLTDLVAR